jgi:cytochrome c-type biogenesis protein CcmF
MIGSIIITLALIFSIISMLMYFFSFRGARNTLNIARLSYHAMSMLVIIAATFLLYLILTHQYQYSYVYSYSSSDLPLGFKISTFWAGQEGSFLLWLFMTAIVGIILQAYSSKRGDLEERVMTVFTLATTFLLLMVSPLFKNPFAYIYSEPGFIDIKNINPAYIMQPILEQFRFSDPNSQQSFIKMGPDLAAVLQSAGISLGDFVIQGKGLNPLLQNFWMQIHPPILFAGFALSTVPFVFALSALMKNDYREWVKQSFPWVLTGAGMLGLGIMLGGYWAYGILGWGGYWAWDPVENASLVPWLLSVASVHTLLVQQKSIKETGGIGRFAKTNLILCILTYVLVLYGTFLTRSGVLGDSSVHSFVDPGRLVYMFLIVFVSLFALLGFGAIIYRWKSLDEKFTSEESLLSRELALFTASVALGASALIVFVGTSAPIFKQSVETSFYNEMHIPIGIIIGLLNGFSFLLKWKETKGSEILKKSLFSLSASAVITIAVIIFGRVTDILMILMIFANLFALLVNAEIAYKIVLGNKIKIGGFIAHIGISLFILGVVGSAAYGSQVDIDLEKGKPVKALGYTLTFTGYTPIENNTKYAFLVDVNSGSGSRQVMPVMYISPFNNSLMREPDIWEGITKDFYIEPRNYDEGSREHKDGEELTVEKGGTVEYGGVKIKYEDIFKEGTMGADNFSFGLIMKVDAEGKTYTVKPSMKRGNGEMIFIPGEVAEANLSVKFLSVDPETQKAVIAVSKIVSKEDEKPAAKEILSVQASVKPFISFVWIGVGVMVLGFAISFVRRLKESVQPE